MTATELPAGVVEIAGEDVWGGEEIGPWVVKLGGALAGACLVAVANNWSAFKESFAEGFSSGASGEW